MRPTETTNADQASDLSASADCSVAVRCGWVAMRYHGDEDDIGLTERVENAGSFGKKDYGPGWKVCWKDPDDGTEWLTPMTFARKKDAELAARAVRSLLDWREDLPSMKRQIQEIGAATLRKTMVEAMAW